MTRMVRMTPNTARLLSKAVQYSCHSSHSGDTAVRLSVAPLARSFRESAMNPKKSAADVHPRRLPLSIRRGYASRAVIGTLRPTERRRANPSKWVDRISSLELYVLPKETGNQLECRRNRYFRLHARMELRGLEPLTSWVRSRRSPS